MIGTADEHVLVGLAEQERARRELSRRHFHQFIPYVFPGYDMQWFHRVVCDKLEKVRKRESRKLAVFLPPQHGKSQIVSRQFPAFALGKDPDEKIAIASYSATLAESFSRAVQRLMEDRRYTNIFPETRLPAKGEGLRNAEIFEVAGRFGFVKAVGVGGSLTGTPVDIAIIDDPIKDRQEAQSITVRDNVWQWYTDVLETRLHNDSVQILIQTRWDQDDLAGRVLKRDGIYSASNPGGWEVVTLPALRTREVNDYDPRQTGEALWEAKHSRDRILKIKEDSPATFNSLYQQDPQKSTEVLVYSNWIKIPEFPDTCEVIFYGQDFGFTNDPSAGVKIGVSGRNLFVQEMMYEKGMTNTDIRIRWKSVGIGHRELFCDSAEPKSIRELKNPQDENGRRLVGQGLNAIPTIKGPDSLDAGISKLKEYNVHYTADSINLEMELKNYSWIFAGGVNTNIPIDKYNHLLDAVRGAVYTKYFKPGRKRKIRERQG